MKKIYVFDVIETNYGTVRVEANNIDEAHIKADEAMEYGQWRIDEKNSDVENPRFAFIENEKGECINEKGELINKHE